MNSTEKRNEEEKEVAVENQNDCETSGEVTAETAQESAEHRLLEAAEAEKEMDKQIKDHVKHSIQKFLAGRFHLNEDSAEQSVVEENIRKGVEFRGQNLWILIFAIVVASVGLNVNSTAVIIGAMLISPLMGPIMGFGLSLGIYDFELLKRSIRNLLFAVIVGLAASSLYFMLTPITLAQSELLARTQPTIWDVLIAFFGGLAGIVAQTRKDRTTTVIPGVAIATALMPPLCTAGYGLGTMQFQYFIGALYLFTINAVLISVATFIIVRYLKYEKKQQLNKQKERKVRLIIYSVIFITIVPSVILGYRIVQKTLFQANSAQFVAKAFDFKNTQVVDFTAEVDNDRQTLTILLMGQQLSDDALAVIESQKRLYSLQDVKVVIKQQSAEGGETTSQSIEKLYNVSNTLIAEKDKRIKELEAMSAKYIKDTLNSSSISREFTALTNTRYKVALSKAPLYDNRGMATDTVLLCVVNTPFGETNWDEKDKERITNWLKARTKTHSVQLIIAESPKEEKIEALPAPQQ